MKYYTTLLLQQIRSDDLAYIISSATDYKEKNPDTGALLNSWKVADYYEKYDDKDKNFLMADTLNSLDRVLYSRFLITPVNFLLNTKRHIILMEDSLTISKNMLNMALQMK